MHCLNALVLALVNRALVPMSGDLPLLHQVAKFMVINSTAELQETSPVAQVEQGKDDDQQIKGLSKSFEAG